MCDAIYIYPFILLSQTDPNNVNLGVGLGLPGLKPGIESKALVANALINRSHHYLMINQKTCKQFSRIIT